MDNNKKKKKGFTLIELLAVIVILAVIILLATNVIIPLLNKARKKSLLDEAHVYQNAAQNYHAFDLDSNDQTASCISIEDLNGEYVKKNSDKYKGVVKTEFINNEFVQTINLTDGKYYVVGKGNLSLSNVKTNKPGGFTISCEDFNPVLAGDVNENSLAYKLLMNEGGTTLDDNLDIINARVANFNNVEDNPDNSGIYKAVDDDGATYYYRGDVNNNWVKFGNYLWRVVRINGDGSIRLIYSGLASASSHTGGNAQIGTSAFGDTQSFNTTTTDLYDPTQTVTTTYSNGRYGNTNVGYMYNPAKVISVYPNITPGSATANRLNYFPTFTNISNTTTYYFFKNFDPSTDCFTGSNNDESGACTLKCRSKGNDGDSGIDCVQSNWNTLATTSGNFSTTDPGVYSTQYIYKSDYKYTCWSYGTPVTKTNGDGTTSVYITCPVVSEIVGTVKNQPTQAKVKYHGVFSADATTANTNVKDSKIKSTIDTWYGNNIYNKQDGSGNDLEDYLSDEIFCNDRSSTSADFPLVNSSSYSYGPYNRNTASNIVPSFRCPNKSNNAFTLKTSGANSTVTASGDGNNMLTYPVGLITIDEAAYAGGKSGSTNYKYYLCTGNYYWTMSPSYFHSDTTSALVWRVTSSGSLTSNTSHSASASGVRPVVNLRSDVLYSSGSGIESDPYQITI